MRTRTRTERDCVIKTNSRPSGLAKFAASQKPLQRRKEPEGGRDDVAAGVARSTFLVNYDATDAREGEAKRRFCTSFSTLCFSFSEIVERNQGAISILASMICIQLVQFQGGIPADVI